MSFNLTHGDSKVLDLQTAMLGEEARQTFFWRPWIGYSKPQTLEQLRRQKVINVDRGKVVKMIRAGEAGAYTGTGGKQKGGGDHWLMYDKKAITGLGVHGDKKVLGTGTTRKLDSWDFYINRTRNEALVHIGEMEKLREGQWAVEAVKEVGPDLMDWAQRYESWYSYAETLFFKYPANITGAVLDGGYAVDQEYHPNMMFLGMDQGTGLNREFATWLSTPIDLDDAATETYARNCAINLVSVNPDNPRCLMTATALRRIEKNARERRIAPLNLPGGVSYLLALHPDSLEDLQSDEEYARLLQNWNNQALDQSDVFFKNANGVFSNMLICAEWNGPCEVYPRENTTEFVEEGAGLNNVHVKNIPSLARQIMFGPIRETSSGTEVEVKDMTVPRDCTRTDHHDYAGAALTGIGVESQLLAKRCNLLLGEYALHGMEVQDYKFFREETDYGNRKGMDIDFIRSLSRPDKKDATPTYADNTSSMLVMSAYSGVIAED